MSYEALMWSSHVFCGGLRNYIVDGVDSFCRDAAYVTIEDLILCLFDLPSFSVCESGNSVSLITVSIALLAWSFCIFLTSTNHFPEDSVKYMCSSPITD